MSGQGRPGVSLILATLGETPHLPRLAASLAAQRFRDFELIIVNQGAPEAIRDFVGHLPEWLNVVELRSEKGLSRARNVGLMAARGEILGFPDDDAWYPPELLADVAGLFAEHEDLGIVTGVTRDEHGVLSNGTFMTGISDLRPENIWRAGNSNSIFIRTGDALAVGGFDEELGAGSGTPFGSGEETDIMLRVLAVGRAGRFFPDLVVHHDQVDVAVTASAMRRARLYAVGYGHVLRLHGYSPAFALYRSCRSLAAALVAGLRGHPREARRRLVWARGILRGYAMSPSPAAEQTAR